MSTTTNLKHTYWGGCYRTWRTATSRPVRSKYHAQNVPLHVFPEDIECIAEPNRPYNFYWHNPADPGALDDLMDKGYFRVIANNTRTEFTTPNAKFEVRRWRSGPEGTVLSKAGELWAQPAEVGEEIEDREQGRFNPQAQAKQIDAEFQQQAASIRREGVEGMEVFSTSSSTPVSVQRKKGK